MKESKQDKLNNELAEFFTHLHEEYGTGCGLLALDLGKSGEMVLGMMFGRKSQLNNYMLDRLSETCESTIKGARVEYGVKEDDDDEEIELPDPSDRKAVAEFVLKHDLLNEEGKVDKKKTDALFDKLIEQKKKEYIERVIKNLKEED